MGYVYNIFTIIITFILWYCTKEDYYLVAAVGVFVGMAQHIIPNIANCVKEEMK